MGRNPPWSHNPNPSRGYVECGNGRVEGDEQCDCGDSRRCKEVDPCCNPETCMLAIHAECAKGPCCDSNCRLRAKGFPCRKSMSECDIPEVCDGLHGTCPIDIYKKTGSQCEGDKGYCFRGRCPTRDTQCNHIWGSDGKSSNESCYNKLNTQGVFTGNCGKYRNGSYIKCALENAKCGKLFCQNGRPAPIVSSPNTSYFKAAFNIHGRELECKVLNYDDSGHDDDWSLTHDGTACGKNLVCINQTCTSIYVYIEPGHCMTNNSLLECSGHGVCSNINTCYCNPGWTGEDCSSYDKSLHYLTTAPPHHGHTTASSAQTADEKKNTTLDRNIHIGGRAHCQSMTLRM